MEGIQAPPVAEGSPPCILDAIDSLPDHVACAIYEQLSPRDAAAASVVCRRWRRSMPFAALLRLTLTSAPCERAFPVERLPDCARLHTLTVHTNRSAAWCGALAVLQRCRLPALWRVEIEHWAGERPGMLDELAAAMQVGCLHAWCVMMSHMARHQSATAWLQLPAACLCRRRVKRTRSTHSSHSPQSPPPLRSRAPAAA